MRRAKLQALAKNNTVPMRVWVSARWRGAKFSDKQLEDFQMLLIKMPEKLIVQSARNHLSYAQ